jgi:hypothetical protein
LRSCAGRRPARAGAARTIPCRVRRTHSARAALSVARRTAAGSGGLQNRTSAGRPSVRRPRTRPGTAGASAHSADVAIVRRLAPPLRAATRRPVVRARAAAARASRVARPTRIARPETSAASASDRGLVFLRAPTFAGILPVGCRTRRSRTVGSEARTAERARPAPPIAPTDRVRTGAAAAAGRTRSRWRAVSA